MFVVVVVLFHVVVVLFVCLLLLGGGGINELSMHMSVYLSNARGNNLFAILSLFLKSVLLCFYRHLFAVWFFINHPSLPDANRMLLISYKTDPDYDYTIGYYNTDTHEFTCVCTLASIFVLRLFCSRVFVIMTAPDKLPKSLDYTGDM